MSKQVGKVHENICIFYRKQCTYNPIMIEATKPRHKRDMERYVGNTIKITKMAKTKYRNDWDGSKAFPRSVQYYSRDKGKENHPTQKPLALIKWLVITFSDKCDIILDPFLGSGTTAVAAKQLGRKYIGIEISEKYCQIARDRLRQEVLF